MYAYNCKRYGHTLEYDSRYIDFKFSAAQIHCIITYLEVLYFIKIE
jgi:hypothetical protein